MIDGDTGAAHTINGLHINKSSGSESEESLEENKSAADFYSKAVSPEQVTIFENQLGPSNSYIVGH